MSPPKKGQKDAHKRSTSSSSSAKGPTRPSSVKFDMDACTSRHAGCIGIHHQHSTHSPAELIATHTGEHAHNNVHSGNPKRESLNSRKVSPSHKTGHSKGESSSSHKKSSVPTVPTKSGHSGQSKGDIHNPSKTAQPKSAQLSTKRHPQGFVNQVHPESASKTRKVTISECSAETGICSMSPQMKDNNYNTNNSASSSQQCSRSIICCNENASIMQMMENVHSPITFLKDKILRKIFRYLNQSDLLDCRLVQKHWYNLITYDQHFLDSTVFVVSIQKSYNIQTDTLVYNDLLECANLPYPHARLQYIDYHYFKDPEYFTFRNSDNENYFPRPDFLKNLSSLEFSNCYLLWSTLKRILAKTVLLDKLVISNCYISEVAFTTNTMNEFDDFTAGNTVFGLKALEIYEARGLDNINRILTKLIGYSNQSLTSLKIRHYPPANRTEVSNINKTDCFSFCRELKALIALCANSLQVLVVDVQHQPSLDLLSYHLSKELEALSNRLSLNELVFSPALGVWLDKPDDIPMQDVAITMNSSGNDSRKLLKNTVTSLGRFLETQKNLKKLGLPCIAHPGALTGCFKSLLQRLPCAPNLQYLAVPSAGFLPDDFLHQFPNLRGLKVGPLCCGDSPSAWTVFRHYSSERNNSTGNSEAKLPPLPQSRPLLRSITLVSDELSSQYFDLMKNIEELHISSCESPEKFNVLARGLCNLTCLEVNSGLDAPIWRDIDLQACAKYLNKLKSLVISCSQNLTDFGITGIPEKYCQLMFKHQKYHSEDVNTNVWNSEKVRGRPLSDLKGLRKLVLMGSSKFTDIGIAYGLSFHELKYCHLPYSDNITAWGIERFGKTNPSIESLVLSGVSQFTKDAFLEFKKTQGRVKKGDSSRSSYFRETESPLCDNFALILPTPGEVLVDLYQYFTKNLYAMYAVLQGQCLVRGGGVVEANELLEDDD